MSVLGELPTRVRATPLVCRGTSRWHRQEPDARSSAVGHAWTSGAGAAYGRPKRRCGPPSGNGVVLLSPRLPRGPPPCGTPGRLSAGGSRAHRHHPLARDPGMQVATRLSPGRALWRRHRRCRGRPSRRAAAVLPAMATAAPPPPRACRALGHVSAAWGGGPARPRVPPTAARGPSWWWREARPRDGAGRQTGGAAAAGAPRPGTAA